MASNDVYSERKGSEAGYGSRNPPAQVETSAGSARVLRLRRELFRRNGINIPANDPICVLYTMFENVVDELLTRAGEERELEVGQMRASLSTVGESVAEAIADASRPVARAMGDVLDPRAIASQVCSELYDDLQRETRRVTRDARFTIITVGVTSALICGILLLASSYRLARAEVLAEDAARVYQLYGPDQDRAGQPEAGEPHAP